MGKGVRREAGRWCEAAVASRLGNGEGGLSREVAVAVAGVVDFASRDDWTCGWTGCGR